MKALLLILLLNFSFGYSQTLSGYVYDDAEKKPLEGAFVYIDGTTFSASTDARGFFSIKTPQKYNAPLIISFVGFETLRIDDPYQYNKAIKVFLREDAIMLNEVVISKGGPFTRKQMMRAFRQQFLGERGGSSCKIENEDDITLYYNTKDNTLHAQAYKPIVVRNKYLEYRLSFNLEAFQVDYSITTLNHIYVRRSFFAGTTFFTDLSEKGGADKKRKEAYLGSPVHFMRTIAGGNWLKEHYQLYADRVPVEHDHYFKVTDSLNYKKVQIIDIPESVKKTRLEIAANGLQLLKKKGQQNSPKFADVKFLIMHNKEQSTITFSNGYFYIDHNGLFFPIYEITYGGYMGELKAGDLLPADYEYTP